jgi:peptidyl-prolyl cis-trans isomerase B (cyclophilin B)
LKRKNSIVILSEAQRSRSCNAADEVSEARLSIPQLSNGAMTGCLDFARHDNALMPFVSMKFSIVLAVLLTSAAFASEEKKEEKSPMNSSNEVAVIMTNEGDMVVQFWTDAAPNTVVNFKKLARQGFYDGTIFHRIVKEFMIQGGDPNSKDPAKENSYGQGGPGYNLKAEFNDHSHDRGVISMARGPDPDSGGSQFFICLAPVHRLDHQYTTFGKLIKGQDVLEKIGDIPVTKNSMGEPSKPTKRVVIESIKIVPADSVK